MDKSDYEVGDPRRVLAAANEAPGQPLTELLWGSQDPEESLRMARIIVEGGWLAITLNEHGAEAFTYLKGAHAGMRVIYFVNHFAKGGVTESPMLIGRFLFELEKWPATLRFPFGNTGRVYFRKNGPDAKDRRVQHYDLPTEAEIDDTRRRIRVLAQKYHPAYRGETDRLLKALDRQDPRLK